MEKELTTLIVGGCSYADPNFWLYKELGIETWPSLLAKKHSYDLINTARGGRGNRHIVNSVIDAIVANQDKDIVVAVVWSEIYRLSYIDDTELDHPVFLFSDEELKRRQSMSEGLAAYFDNLELGRQQIIKSIKRMQKDKHVQDSMIDLNSKMVLQAFRNIWYLQDFCAQRNIKMYHMHAFDAFAYDKKLTEEMYIKFDTDAQVKDAIEQNYYYQQVQNDNYYMGSEYNLYNDIESNELFIQHDGNVNWHPNQQGHEYIANMVDNFMQTGIRLNNKTENTYRGFIYD